MSEAKWGRMEIIQQLGGVSVAVDTPMLDRLTLEISGRVTPGFVEELVRRWNAEPDGTLK